MTPTGLTLGGLYAAYETRPREFRVLLLRGNAVEVSGEWEARRGRSIAAMEDRADAVLRRTVRERGA